MKAMVIEKITSIEADDHPLTYVELPVPEPETNEIRLRIKTCAVCHTELDEIEGRTLPPRLPVVPGHQVVGTIDAKGSLVTQLELGQRVGVAWIFSACGRCLYCTSGRENLCAEFRATGRDVNGGYAEYLTVPASFAIPIPEHFSDEEAAPLLCAGAIGYRSLKLTGLVDGQNLGLTGFGASGHLVLKLAKFVLPQSDVFVFARSPMEREFARDLGAVWAGDTLDEPPEKLEAVIDTTPVWKPVVEALRHLAPGGRLVINAIRKEDVDKEYLLQIDYPTHLWLEKEIISVANVTRQDVIEFLNLAAEMGIRPEVQEFPLAEANLALMELKNRQIRGAKVLIIK